MPHIIIEATSSIARLVDLQTLTHTVHQAACGIEGFPTAGVRTRLHVAEHFCLAENADDGAFVHANIRIGPGFTSEARRAGAEAVADSLSRLLAPHLPSTPISLSVEVTELDPAVRVNRSNVAQILAARAPKS